MIFVFGDNKYGQVIHSYCVRAHFQLGIGYVGGKKLVPVLLNTIKGALMISCGSHHSGAMTGKELFMWGMGQHGQLGNGELQNKGTPQLVEDVDPSNYKYLQLGFNHSSVLGYENDVQPLHHMLYHVCIKALFLLSFTLLPLHHCCLANSTLGGPLLDNLRCFILHPSPFHFSIS